MQPEDIIKKEFSRSFLGYDMREVDVFLDEIIDRMEQMEGERKEMIAAMEYLLGKLENQGELPVIQTKFLKGAAGARTGEKTRTTAQEKRKREQPEKSKPKREQREPRPAEELAAEQPEKPREKRPPRKILQRHEKLESQAAKAEVPPEPVAIEMETLESAPPQEGEKAPSGREDAV